MKRLHYRRLGLAIALASSAVHATPMVNLDPTNTYAVSISSLTVSNNTYDVVFHPNTSFNDLFDQNSDRVLEITPTFWGDQTGARAAAVAIMAALGDNIKTAPSQDGDHFLVPYQEFALSGISISVFLDYAGGLPNDALDDGSRIRTERMPAYPYVTFSDASSVPVPSTLGILFLGLAGLGCMSRSERRTLKVCPGQ